MTAFSDANIIEMIESLNVDIYFNNITIAKACMTPVSGGAGT